MLKLIQGDCLEVMKDIPDGSVDMVLTDPPYGISFQSNYRKDKHNPIKNDNNLNWINDFVDEIYRVSKDNTASYVFCSWHHVDVFKVALQRKFKIKNLLIWEKNNTGMGDLKGDFAPKVEMIFLLHKGRSLIRGSRDANIFKFSKTHNKHHPTEKPLDLNEYLISKFSDEGETILDPFMGSGTTGVAAKNLNRDFIGIELDETYFNIAKERIR